MNDNQNSQERDCAVCLQKCHYPTQLPCGHIFCFLCVKGVARTNKRCAMCRAAIPADYLDHPDVLSLPTTQIDEEFHWYYLGGNRTGWWKYEERHNTELEMAYTAGDPQCKLLIAGILYCIDFQKMIQYQSRDPSRRRRVQRDTPLLPVKGIAGIKIEITHRAHTKSESEESTATDSTREDLVSSNDENSDADETNDESEPELSRGNINSMANIIQRLSTMDLQEPDTYGSSTSSRNVPENQDLE